MASVRVIKVKYGDTLRRFNSLVDETGKLDLNIEKLRAKIISLFNFTADADITLTYIDEDGDLVTLIDDDDLCDAVRQDLNPLRLNVVVNVDNGDRSHSRSSGSSTPLRSHQGQPPLPSFNNHVAEVLKSVPEPLREGLLKPFLDMTKTASYAPAFAELIECFSKVGLSFVNSNTQKDQSGACPQESGVPKDGEPLTAGVPDTKFVEATSKRIQKLDVGGANQSLPSAAHNIVERMEIKNGNKVSHSGKESEVGSQELPNERRPAHLGIVNECPFSGVPVAGDGIPHPLLTRSKSHGSDSTTGRVKYFPVHPFERVHSQSDNIPIFHKGVQCDGCGVYPITGSRFKSTVKEDYDLCSVCFGKMGNEADYIRMDRPASYGYPWVAGSAYNHVQVPNLHPPALHPSAFQRSLRDKVKTYKPNWGSRFVKDVNVVDGTMMAPSTQFTKIWRLRNSGNIAWPQGTRLVWIGGDRLGSVASIPIETSFGGVPVDTEIDVAVDFKAPKVPGRYVSYWTLAMPSGHKFGQRVWVLIQVDTSVEVADKLTGVNLNLPPESSGPKGAEFLDINVRPTEAETHPQPLSPTARQSVEQVASQVPIQDQELNFPINDTLLVGSSVPDPAPSKVTSSLSYPVVGSSEAPQTAASYEPSFVREALRSSGGTSEYKDVEESLLKELEEMGFKQVDLNKEILRMNEFNLEQSVDDLCGVAEWDPILEELEEMGFCDKETNRKLLKKNNGSIKRVVLDLIAGEKSNAKEKTQ